MPDGREAYPMKAPMPPFSVPDVYFTYGSRPVLAPALGAFHPRNFRSFCALLFVVAVVATVVIVALIPQIL